MVCDSQKRYLHVISWLITIHEDNFTTVSPSNLSNVSMIDHIIKRYEDVFSKELGTLPWEVHLHIQEITQPVITPPDRIPTALKDKFKDELNRLEDLSVLSKVNERTDWVSSVVVTTKKRGQLRVCIDPHHLKKALKRETYQLLILDDFLPELSCFKVFSTIDLIAGYWHCILDEPWSLLTTFSNSLGRYKWNGLPFGLSASSEIFQKWVNQALDRLEG